ncbi:MAG: hypothetical protein ACE5Z5_04450 [Candidatus Bathyarchaeia archaeon]
MNYIGFFEFCPEDFGKVIEKFRQAMAEREKEPEKFPKILFGPVSMGGEWKGFVLYENATPEQIMNVVIHYEPEMTYKFVPLLEATKLIELYLKKK